MAKNEDAPRPPKPSKEPGCTCADYAWSMGHWVQVLNKNCPLHGLPDEDPDRP